MHKRKCRCLQYYTTLKFRNKRCRVKISENLFIRIPSIIVRLKLTSTKYEFALNPIAYCYISILYNLLILLVHTIVIYISKTSSSLASKMIQ